MNSVNMIGRWAKSPEIRYSGDLAIAHCSIAVDKAYKRDGEPTAHFFDCTAFGKVAEIIEKYTDKGSLVGISGHLNTNYWEKDGKKHKEVDIIIDTIKLCETRNTDRTTQNDNDFVSVPDNVAEELPFN